MLLNFENLSNVKKRTDSLPDLWLHQPKCQLFSLNDFEKGMNPKVPAVHTKTTVHSLVVPLP